MRFNFSFGSKAKVAVTNPDIRFNLVNGLRWPGHPCLECADFVEKFFVEAARYH
jgi:hypothetical protein